MPRVPFLCSQTWVSFPSDINPAVPETWYSSLLDNWIHDLLYANSCPCSYLLAWQKLTVGLKRSGVTFIYSSSLISPSKVLSAQKHPKNV